MKWFRKSLWKVPKKYLSVSSKIEDLQPPSCIHTCYIPHFQNSYLSGWLLLQQLRNEKGQQSITQLGLIRVLRHFTWVIISSNMRGWKLYLQGHSKNLAYRVWVSLAKPYTKILEKFEVAFLVSRFFRGKGPMKLPLSVGQYVSISVGL